MEPARIIEMVELADLKLRFQESPALALLRSPYAPEIAAFLDGAFKSEYRLAIPGDDLAAMLQAFLETEVHPQSPLTFPKPPREYLEEWCRDEVAALRRHAPATRAVMMDRETLDTFRNFAGRGTPATSAPVSGLTPDEATLFHELTADNIRLEQEKIPHSWASQALRAAVAA
jgi:hypothetical protein